MVTVLSVYFITCMEFILKLIRMERWYLELWPKKKKWEIISITFILRICYLKEKKKVCEIKVMWQETFIGAEMC